MNVVEEEEEDNPAAEENSCGGNRCEEFRECRQLFSGPDYQEEEEHYVIINGKRCNLRP